MPDRYRHDREREQGKKPETDRTVEEGRSESDAAPREDKDAARRPSKDGDRESDAPESGTRDRE